MPNFVESLIPWAGSAIMLVVGLGVVRLALQRWRQPDRPASTPVVGWSSLEIVFAFFSFLLIPAIVVSILESSGFFRSVYGHDFPPLPPLGAEPAPDQKSAQTLRQLWAVLFTAPIFVFVLVFVLRELRGVPMREVGIRFDAIPDDIVRGYHLWLWLMPLTFLVYFIANVLFWSLAGVEADDHTLTLLLPNATSLTWTLFALQVVVAGPIVEELLFRGVLLPWLVERWENSVGCMVTAIGMACLFGVGAGRDQPDWLQYAPILFAVVIMPIVVALRSRPQQAAILASAALFGVFHATVWPTPIPLLVLGVGLGWLRLRTGSLIGPIFVHGAFNAVSLISLMLGGK